jgi:hypothetical protein
MIRMTFTRLATAGTALLLAAAFSAPSQAASAGVTLPQSTIGKAESSLVEAGYYRNRHRYRHGHGGFRFFFAPVIVGGGGYYGYDRYRERRPGRSCYSVCRDYNGPEYCRYEWRRYCD